MAAGGRVGVWWRVEEKGGDDWKRTEIAAGGREGVWGGWERREMVAKGIKRECWRVGEKGNGGRRERKIMAAGGRNGGR